MESIVIITSGCSNPPNCGENGPLEVRKFGIVGEPDQHPHRWWAGNRQGCDAGVPSFDRFALAHVKRCAVRSVKQPVSVVREYKPAVRRRKVPSGA